MAINEFKRHCRTHWCRDCSFYNFKNEWSIPCSNIFEKMTDMRNDYCITKADQNCDSCPFSFHKNGLDKACRYLTAFEIADIFNKIEDEKKENKTMNTTELEQEIAKTKEQLERLEKALDEAKNKNKVPDQLEWDIGEKYWVVDSIGNIIQFTCNEFTGFDKSTHHMFKTKDYAKLYAEKTQFIADLLHFKWLYDRDYVPDWSSDEDRYSIYFNTELNEYTQGSIWWKLRDIGTVYFSTEEIAQKCADWLNSRRKEE